MKYLKKTTALLLTVLLLFSAMVTGFTVSAEANTATITAAAVEVEASGTVNVPVKVTTTGLAAAVLTITVDDALTIDENSIVNGEQFAIQASDVYNNVITVAVTAAGDANVVGTDVALISFDVTAPAEAAEAMPITVAATDTSDWAEVAVTVSTVDGSVTIKAAEAECTHANVNTTDAVSHVEFTETGITYYEICPDCSDKVVTSTDSSENAVTVAGKALAQKYYSAINVTEAGTYTIDVTDTADLQYAYVDGDKIIANAATNFHASLYDGDESNGENAFATSLSGSTVTVTTDFAGVFIAFVPKNASRLTTGGTIGMNTYFSLESSIAMDLAINTKNITTPFDDYYAIVNHQKYSGTTPLEVEDVLIEEYTVNGTYYRFNYRIAAMEMNDEISYRWYGVADGIDYLLRERVNYTLVNYAANQYANSSASADLKTLLSTLFKYGATAQEYFNYRNTETTLVTSNSAISSYYEQYPAAVTISQESIEKLATTGSTHLDSNNKQFAYSRGLNCESTVEVYFGVKCLDFFNANSNVDPSKFTFVISYIKAADAATGTFTTEEFTYEDAYKVTESEKRYFFRADKIAATMMPSETKVDVYYDGVWQSGCNYSINNYLYNNYTKTSTVGGTATLGEICQSIATYGATARSYFAS